jgi:hypothetical protein
MGACDAQVAAREERKKWAANVFCSQPGEMCATSRYAPGLPLVPFRRDIPVGSSPIIRPALGGGRSILDDAIVLMNEGTEVEGLLI